ncbi:hypothetical protein TIFTF001_010286 [Ficus carica]|uniref:Fe2OG dioxygenase domain-containing protein n=1 Tax=Ficus carica TaxID=3494 RepID=A0AA88D3B6_FICCA|nr:hypothetical protein TIFTF001_010286 [Ficus carica]
MSMAGHESNSSSFRIGESAQEKGLPYIINHGICQSVLDDTLSSAFDFFRLPAAEKVKFMSNDVYKPVRYGTSLRDGIDKTLTSMPKKNEYPQRGVSSGIVDWEKIGRYCKEVRKLGLELMGPITESLGLSPNYMRDKLEEGMQVMVVNCYPPCPNPDLALGLPPHSDYSCLTIVLQSSPGLEIMDAEAGTWRLVPELPGALQVHVGDHFKVLGNGTYKSIAHRAILSRDTTRVSVVSFHSSGMDEKMGTAEELMDHHEERPYKKYRESSFRDFLNFLSTNDIGEGKTFINTLKIDN